MEYDANDSEMSDTEVKKEVVNKCFERDECDLKNSMENLKKMEEVKRENCKMKNYMSRKSIQDVREIFAARLSLIPLGGNFKHDKRFLVDNWLCVGCVNNVLETQEHVATSCPGYADIRERFDLTSDDGMLEFYREVLKRRNEEVD